MEATSPTIAHANLNLNPKPRYLARSPYFMYLLVQIAVTTGLLIFVDSE